MAQKSIEQMIYEETEQRLKIMENPKYKFPKRIGKTDIIGIIAAIGISLLLIISCILEVAV